MRTDFNVACHAEHRGRSYSPSLGVTSRNAECDPDTETICNNPLCSTLVCRQQPRRQLNSCIFVAIFYARTASHHALPYRGVILAYLGPNLPRGSLGPGARKFDHLGPFLSIVDDELAELGPGRRHGRAAEVGKARLQARVREHSVECRIQLIDDFERRSAWHDYSIPQAGLESLDGFPDGGHVR